MSLKAKKRAQPRHRDMGDDSDDEDWVPYYYYYHTERGAAQFEHPIDGELHQVEVQVD
jgi:hypothetical protein